MVGESADHDAAIGTLLDVLEASAIAHRDRDRARRCRLGAVDVQPLRAQQRRERGDELGESAVGRNDDPLRVHVTLAGCERGTFERLGHTRALEDRDARRLAELREGSHPAARVRRRGVGLEQPGATGASHESWQIVLVEPLGAEAVGGQRGLIGAHLLDLAVGPRDAQTAGIAQLVGDAGLCV